MTLMAGLLRICVSGFMALVVVASHAMGTGSLHAPSDGATDSGVVAGPSVPERQEWTVEIGKTELATVTVGASRAMLQLRSDGTARLDLELGRIEFLQLGVLAPFPPLVFECPAVDWTLTGAACRGAMVGVVSNGGNEVSARDPGDIGYSIPSWSGKGAASVGTDGVQASFRGVRIPWADGIVQINFRHGSSQPTVVEVAFDRVSIKRMVVHPTAPISMASGVLSGHLNLTLEPSTGTAASAAWSFTVSGLDFSTVDDRYAGEDLGVISEGHVRAGRSLAATASGDLTLKAQAGFLAVGGMVLDLGAASLDASLKFEPTSDGVRWQASVEHQGLLRASGGGELVATPSSSPDGSDFKSSLISGLRPSTLAARFEAKSFADAFPAYFEALIPNAPTFTVGGSLYGTLGWTPADGWAVGLRLADVSVAEPESRYAIAGLSGALEWRDGDDGGTDSLSNLAWEGISLLRVSAGAGQVEGRVWGRRFELTQPTRIPFLDGVLVINAFDADGLASSDLNWRLRARLEPVSVEAVSEAFGWPSFGGTVAGAMPGIEFRNGTVTLDGSIAVELLGGAVEIGELVLEDPFGIIPRLTANVSIRRISLAALTQAFSFGRISGRVDGEVLGLELVDWQPAGFNARFFSSPKDDLPHRISQRAVDNLASLGGGPTALLSTTFLRFFEEFSYEDLGLSCRMSKGVCEMGGIADADDGYFLVRGSGVPRISVKGYNRRVDWASLVERLIDAARSSGPTISP